VTIRAAEPGDFEAVATLLAELGRPVLTDATRAATREVFEGQLANAHSDHLVALDAAGRVVGFCSLHYRTRLNHPTRQAWIPDLIVTEDARGTGAGRALLAEAERRARARGCHDLTLESSYSRVRAHAVYAAAGMTDAGKSFWKALR
jgi:GNAT superfamily N-acetyltransferase